MAPSSGQSVEFGAALSHTVVWDASSASHMAGTVDRSIHGAGLSRETFRQLDGSRQNSRVTYEF